MVDDGVKVAGEELLNKMKFYSHVIKSNNILQSSFAYARENSMAAMDEETRAIYIMGGKSRHITYEDLSIVHLNNAAGYEIMSKENKEFMFIEDIPNIINEGHNESFCLTHKRENIIQRYEDRCPPPLDEFLDQRKNIKKYQEQRAMNEEKAKDNLPPPVNVVEDDDDEDDDDDDMGESLFGCLDDVFESGALRNLVEDSDTPLIERNLNPFQQKEVDECEQTYYACLYGQKGDRKQSRLVDYFEQDMDTIYTVKRQIKGLKPLLITSRWEMRLNSIRERKTKISYSRLEMKLKSMRDRSLEKKKVFQKSVGGTLSLVKSGQKKFLIRFGGLEVGKVSDSMFAYDIENSIWKCVNPVLEGTWEIPGPMDGHSASTTSDLKTIIYYGGSTEKDHLVGVYVFDVETLLFSYHHGKAKHSSFIPKSRAFHTAVLVKDRYLYIVGGMAKFKCLQVDKMYIMDIQTFTWQEPIDIPQNVFKRNELIHHSMTYWMDRFIVIVNGREVVIYDTVENTWRVERLILYTHRTNPHLFAIDDHILIGLGSQTVSLSETFELFYSTGYSVPLKCQLPFIQHQRLQKGVSYSEKIEHPFDHIGENQEILLEPVSVPNFFYRASHAKTHALRSSLSHAARFHVEYTNDQYHFILFYKNNAKPVPYYVGFGNDDVTFKSYKDKEKAIEFRAIPGEGNTIYLQIVNNMSFVYLSPDNKICSNGQSARCAWNFHYVTRYSVELLHEHSECYLVSDQKELKCIKRKSSSRQMRIYVLGEDTKAPKVDCIVKTCNGKYIVEDKGSVRLSNSMKILSMQTVSEVDRNSSIVRFCFKNNTYLAYKDNTILSMPELDDSSQLFLLKHRVYKSNPKKR